MIELRSKIKDREYHIKWEPWVVECQHGKKNSVSKRGSILAIFRVLRWSLTGNSFLSLRLLKLFVLQGLSHILYGQHADTIRSNYQLCASNRRTVIIGPKKQNSSFPSLPAALLLTPSARNRTGRSLHQSFQRWSVYMITVSIYVYNI